MINSIENRKFSKIFQNSISIASFFDRNREKYEDTSLINLFSFPIFQFKVTATSTKSTIFCQFSINYPSFEPSFPFESLFLHVCTRRGNPAVKEEAKRIKKRIIHDSRVRTQLTPLSRRMLLEEPFRFDTREHRIYLDHHLSNHKLLLRFLVTAVFFSTEER